MATFSDHFAEQLRNPHGAAGRVAGAAMRLINRGPNDLTLRALDVRDGEDILELGFGPGEGIRALAARSPCGKIYGVDQSATMLAQARRRNRAGIVDGRIRLMPGQFESTGLPDLSVDKILAVNVAYFWSDGSRVLAELDRVLRPGGRVAIYVTDASAMARWKFTASGHHRVFDASELRDFLAAGPFAGGTVTVSEVKVGPGIPGLVATIEKPRGGG